MRTILQEEQRQRAEEDEDATAKINASKHNSQPRLRSSETRRQARLGASKTHTGTERKSRRSRSRNDLNVTTTKVREDLIDKLRELMMKSKMRDSRVHEKTSNSLTTSAEIFTFAPNAQGANSVIIQEVREPDSQANIVPFGSVSHEAVVLDTIDITRGE